MSSKKLQPQMFVNIDFAQRLVKYRRALVDQIEKDLTQAKLALAEAEHTLEQIKGDSAHGDL